MTQEYETKSVIIGKAGKPNDKENYPIFVNLFDVNNPHRDPNAMPIKFLEYEDIHKIIIDGLKIEYLLLGKDIIINNLKKIDINVDNCHLNISGEQE
jgi:hypothetical protein